MLALLFSFASFAFYLNFGEVIEELYPDRAIETDTEALPLSE